MSSNDRMLLNSINRISGKEFIPAYYTPPQHVTKAQEKEDEDEIE